MYTDRLQLILKSYNDKTSLTSVAKKFQLIGFLRGIKTLCESGDLTVTEEAEEMLQKELELAEKSVKEIRDRNYVVELVIELTHRNDKKHTMEILKRMLKTENLTEDAVSYIKLLLATPQ